METPPALPDTFVITRSYPTSPERVFAAFADVDKKRRWFSDAKPQEGQLFEMDFRVGGAESARYLLGKDTPFPGVAISNEGSYLDIVPDRRIVIASGMMLGDRRISASMVTIELAPGGQGTELTCTHQAVFFEGADGPTMRRGGWEALFDKLGKELAA
jgi:uncharacterized protein YndB with AHSA1/START domain